MLDYIIVKRSNTLLSFVLFPASKSMSREPEILNKGEKLGDCGEDSLNTFEMLVNIKL